MMQNPISSYGGKPSFADIITIAQLAGSRLLLVDGVSARTFRSKKRTGKRCTRLGRTWTGTGMREWLLPSTCKGMATVSIAFSLTSKMTSMLRKSQFADMT